MKIKFDIKKHWRPANYSDLFWRPISEAEWCKKIGEPILGIDISNLIAIYWWDEDRSEPCWTHHSGILSEPTHFMPIPVWYEK